MSLRNAARGFTIIELMVVVAIGGILSLMAASSVQNIIKSKRVSGEAGSLAMELNDLRVIAVSRGVPAGVCLRLPTYVNNPRVTNNDPGGRTQFVKAAVATTITATEAALATTDQTTDYRELPSYGPTSLDYEVGVAARPTVTILFSAEGLPTAWEGSSCDATTKTALALPLTIGVAQSDNAITPSRLRLAADGSATGIQ